MHMIRTAIAGILALFVASAAVAQTFPNVPGQSVIGRLGIPGGTGPSQAIPLETLKAKLFPGQVTPDAVGNDIVDDAPAINAAIVKAAAAGGGNVYLPRPSVCYRIASPIIMKSGVSLYGDQSTASCIDADNTDGITYGYVTGFGNSTIDGLYIKGKNFSAIRTAINQPGTSNDADVIYGITIRNILIDTFPVGIHFRTVRNLLIENTWIQNVDKGVQFVGQVINPKIVNSTIIRAAGGGGLASSGGLELDQFNYIAGSGNLSPEGLKLSASTFFGFNTCVLLSSANYATLDQLDVGGCLVGVQFANIAVGLQITNGYIEVDGPTATVGIYGVGLGSPIPTQVNIADNTIIASGTVSANGIQINDSGNQNQNNVNIVRNYFLGFTNNDIRLNNPGQSNVENNRCESSGVPTNSISIGQRVSGIVTVNKNNCAKAIALVNPPDSVSGVVRLCDNVVAGVSQGCTWNVTTNSTTANRMMIGGGPGVQPTAAPAGTTTTLWHGNASGVGSYGPVNLATDVTGTLPAANFQGTNQINITSGSPFTYTPTAGMKQVQVCAAGAGGGGGGGSRGATGTIQSGGGAGGGAAKICKWFSATQIGASVTVTLGAGGTAGAAAASDTTAGGNGGAGGNTTFGTLMTGIGGGFGVGGGLAGVGSGGGGPAGYSSAGTASGATGGAGGLGCAAGGSAATGGTGTIEACGSGGGGSTVAGAATNGGAVLFGGSGGGSGAGITAAEATATGGSGGTAFVSGTFLNGGTGGAAGTVGGAGNAPTSTLPFGTAGTGAGGGGSAVTGAAGAGGAGGNCGGAGGGGGSNRNTFTAGAGGVGGGGCAWLIEFF